MSKTDQNIEELLTDDSFLRWINGEAEKTEEEKWHQWFQEDPTRYDRVKEAKNIYKSLQFEEEIPKTLSELNRLRSSVDKYEAGKNKRLSLKRYAKQPESRNSYWTSAAAVIILLLGVLYVARTIHLDSFPQEEEIVKKPVFATASTDYGQIRTLTLSDGSKVILNANSKLTYPKTYNGRDLEVRLEGEAYFSIVHKTGEEQRTFAVQTSEGRLEVLGTKFNVNTRSEKTEVVLEDGKVHLEVADTLSAVKSSYSYTMKPGERALLSPQEKGIDVETTEPDLFTSWRKHELKFSNTPLAEIAREIEQTYGVEVKFHDKEFKQIEFSGSVPNKNFAVLLHGLRTLLEVPIAQNNERIIIGN